ncbi:hypothetical protein LMG24238_07102 [Paraburkholderia sediminicola]|uniref:Autotransporter adhesin n=1 Tax=Paraburkholderia sediminicola TaxID=458836 RepID=A0A6J5CR70_9BURK|nr:YadA-like family protein [Paraburkholderia sediminicola]CAB3743588.1 hypothetical protein LMG24238_07102 [Paraburkholderia sediminicola]
MNKTYRSVWNDASQTWAAAQENATARGKKSSSRALLSLAVVAVASAMSGGAHAATTSGVLSLCGNTNGTNPVNYNIGATSGKFAGGDNACIGSTGYSFALVSNQNPDGSGNGVTPGTSIFGYLNNTLSLHGSAGIIMQDTVDMSAQKITDMAAGAVSASSMDAVNGMQLYGVASSTAAALGAGSSVTATGTVTAPSFTLVNANSINGTSGAATNVGAAFSTVDAALGKLNTAVTNNSRYFKAGGLNDGNDDAKLDGGLGIAVGANAVAKSNGGAGNASVAIGSNSYAVSNYSVSDETGLSVLDSIAIGSGTVASGAGATALGPHANANFTNIAIGAYANASGAGRNSIAIGGASVVSSWNAVSLGALANASANQGMALGYNANASASNSVALGAGSTTTADLTAAGYNPASSTLSGTASTANGEVSVGSASAERRITNVAAGSTTTDAVNVSQLQSEDAKVNAEGAATAAGLGGGSTYNMTTGAITNPKYVVDGGKTFNNVGDVVTNIDSRVAQNTTDIAKNTTDIGNFDSRVTQNTTDLANLINTINNGEIGLVQQDASSRTITVAKDTDGKVVDFTGTVGTRTLTGVTAGELSATSADAVNGSQLYATNQNVSDIKGMVNNLSSDVVNIDGRVTKNTADIGDIDGRVTQNTTDLTNLTNTINNGEIGLVRQDTGSSAITVAKDTDGTVVDFTGTAGARQLTGVAAGAVSATSTDAVNGSQLNALASSTAEALGGGSTVNLDGSITAPAYVVDGTIVHNVGDAIANIDGRVTENATNISNINNTLNNLTIGGGIMYFHANSTLADSQATGAESVAIGGNARSLAVSSVAIGSNSVADRANTMSVGAAGAERQITNVAAGTADTDAVNVAQLRASGMINSDGTTNAAVTYDRSADGAPNYSSVTLGDSVAGGTTIHNVAAGTAGDDAVNVNQMNAAISSITNIASAAGNPMFAADGNRDTEAAVTSGTHSTAMGANARATAANSVALGSNSVADRANTVSMGSAGSERQIANVAAGTATTDAVNVGQLNDSIGAAVGNLPAGKSAKDYTDQRVNSVQDSVNQVAKNSYSGIAAATALTMIPDVDQGKAIAVGIGGGTYKGAQAVALGVSARISQNLKMKAGAGTSSGGTTAGVGASYQW